MESSKTPHNRLKLFSAFCSVGLLYVVYYIWNVSDITKALALAPLYKNTAFLITQACTVVLGISILLGLFSCIRLKNSIIGIVYRIVLFTIVSFLGIFLFFDIHLFTLIGNHIFDSFIIESITNPTVNNEIHLSISTIVTGVSISLFILALPYLLYKGMQYISPRILKISVFSILGIYLISLVLHLTMGVYNIAISPAFVYPSFDSYKTTNKSTSYSTAEYFSACASENKIFTHTPHILIISIESLRSDMVEYMPHFKKLQSQFQSIESVYNFCGVNVTEKSVFTMLFGLDGTRFSEFSSVSQKSFPFQVLQANKYTTYGFSSSNLQNWGKGNFVTKQFDEYKQYPEANPVLDDSTMVEEIKQTYLKRKKGSPSMFFAFFNSTHHNYMYAPRFEKHTPVMPENYNHFMADDSLAVFKEKILNRYKNSVGYVDYLVNKLVEVFRTEIENNNLVLVITSDHGEEFWDKGLLGHGTSNLYACRTQVPFLIHLPKAQKIKKTITSNTQIMPTIFSYLGLRTQSSLVFDAQPMQNKGDYAIITASDYANTGKLCIATKQGKFWVKQKPNTIELTRSFTLQDTDTILALPQFFSDLLNQR